MRNYFINKDNKTGEIVYLEYDKNGYSVSPKAKKKNDIEVNKIVFVSPELTSKLLKKKIDIKINKLLNEYNTIDDDEDDDNGSRLRDKLKEAERLKITILNEYGKYLTDAYIKLTLKKLELIIDGYRSKLYSLRTKKQKEVFLQMFNQIEDNEKEVDKMELLDGKVVKAKLLEDLKEKVDKLDTKLGLTVIQVGDDPASSVYVKQKNKMAESLGFNFNHIKLDENIKEDELLNIIDEMNNDNSVDGILVQMPIPNHLNAKKIQNAILPSKDVDGLTDINMGRLSHNVDSLVPCTPMGIIDLLKYYNIDISGKNVVIVGRSDLVGKPLASLMINHDATVTLCHSKTENLSFYTRNADILVAAIGKANFIKKEDVKDGAVVVDVGINRLEDGKLHGDVFFDDVKDKVSYITPVPGGVGQMTVAELGYNTYKAHFIRAKED